MVVGIAHKYRVETLIGVQYPSLSDTPKTFQQTLYAEREKAIVENWNRIKDTPDKGGYKSYFDFKVNHILNTLFLLNSELRFYDLNSALIKQSIGIMNNCIHNFTFNEIYIF